LGSARRPTDGPERLAWLLRAADERGATVAFDAAAALEKRGACSPFHPARALRAHIDGARASDAPPLRLRLVGKAVRLRAPLHPSCLAEDERPLTAFLARAHTVDEILAAGLCLPFRAEALLAFLWDVGALTAAPAGTSPYTLLELPEGASRDEVKRAYRRLARALHPDHHPSDADPAERARLVERFSEVHAAYRRLIE
jgi:hypothetical protein